MKLSTGQITRGIISKVSPVLIVFFLLVLAFELSIRLLEIPKYLLPAPSVVAQKLITEAGMLLYHTGITMMEAFAGFLLGGFVGVLTAIAFAHSRFLEAALYPYAIALKTIPLVALAPLLVLWFGNGILAKIIMASLICYFPVIVNTLRGLRSVSEDGMDLMASLSASKSQIFWKLRLPSSLPYIFSALKISSTLSVIGAVVGELSGATRGIGYIILTASYRIQTDIVFAAIVATSPGGIMFFVVLGVVESAVAERFGGHGEAAE